MIAMMPTFSRDTVTIHRPLLIEERGTQVRCWDRETTHEITGCSFQPVRASTNWTEPRQAATVRATLYLPPGSDIEQEDMVEFEGAKYAIDGTPLVWKSPSGRHDHMQVSLIDWRG